MEYTRQKEYREINKIIEMTSLAKQRNAFKIIKSLYTHTEFLKALTCSSDS